ALTYRNTRQLYDNARSVVQTHEVLDLTADVLLTLLAAETGEQYFLLTRDEKYFKDYEAALGRLDEYMAALKVQTKDNAEQLGRIEKLEEMTAKWRASMKNSIDLRRQDRRNTLQYIQLAFQSKEQMDGFRELIATMESEERELLIDRQRRS